MGNEGRSRHESDNCENRNDIAGQSVDIELHVRAGDTSVQILQKLQGFMSETGHAPESFPDRIILASMFNDLTDKASQRVHNKCLARSREVATYAARF